MRIFDVGDYGAVGNAKTLDTAAIQRAVNSAAACAAGGTKSQVLLRGNKKYVVGTLELKGPIDFHLADNAELWASTDRSAYRPPENPGGVGAEGECMVIAHGAQGLKITGTGAIVGRWQKFLTQYDAAREWWLPPETGAGGNLVGGWRPRLMVLTACSDLEVTGITFRDAPSWTLHFLGCEKVLVDRVIIRNALDVPNCDGIDPDHCRDMEIKNCDIVCGDDAIVIKATKQPTDFGPCARIVVKDCRLETQDSGLKIGTETFSDIHDITFERCKITTSSRGIGMLLRDRASIYNIACRDIDLVSRYHSDPWWGRGEAISLTAIPRDPNTPIGTLHRIQFDNIRATSENSIRISGSQASRPHDITLNNIHLTLDRWTKYKGAIFDNRPTRSQQELVPHNTPGFYLEHADNITLQNARLTWGKNIPPTFTHAIEAHNTTNFHTPNFQGTAAHPDRHQPISIT